MANFKIHKDYETSERAGAGGMYQIIDLFLEDKNGEEINVTDKVNVGFHFSIEDDKNIYQYLSSTFDIPIPEINIESI